MNITAIAELLADNKTVTQQGLLQLYRQLNTVNEWMVGETQIYSSFPHLQKQPYVHTIVLPAVIGATAAVFTVAFLCCVRACIRRRVRKMRYRRIHVGRQNKLRTACRISPTRSRTTGRICSVLATPSRTRTRNSDTR